MTRLFSFLAAIIVFASASAEVASFVLDHRSWIQENYSSARDYVTKLTRPAPPATQPCDANCTASPQAAGQRCEDIEQTGKKLLCLITLPKPDAVCRKDCPEKVKPTLPGNWIRPEKPLQDKGSMASALAIK
jgi:hypothetical protein